MNTLVEDKHIQKGSMLYRALFYPAALLMPSILLFALYNNNWAESQLLFTHVIVLGGGLAVAGLLLFLLLKLAIGSSEGALLVGLLFWMGFWMFESMYGFAIDRGALLSSDRFLVLLCLGVVLIAGLLRRYAPPFWKIRPAFGMLSICIVALFLVNFQFGASNRMTLLRAQAEFAEHEDNAYFHIKRSFLVDHNLPSPDIYWFWLDGLMSIAMLERYFEESHEELRGELIERGFVIYEDAILKAGDTRIALHALFMPLFYDSFFGELLAENRAIESRGRYIRAIADGLTNVGLAHDEVQAYNEFFNALAARGYDVVIASRLGGRLTWDGFDGYIFGFPSPWHRFGDLPELLSLVTPLRFNNNYYNFDFYDAGGLEHDSMHHRESRNDSLANFTFLLNAGAHMGGLRRAADYDEKAAIELYPARFLQVVEQTLQRVDAILEENPYAVIILQGDHGWHLFETIRFLWEQGYTWSEIQELWFSVFSAVRIPERYGGLDAPLEPRNISRELVNRFVGQNYVLLPQGDLN